MFPSSRFLRTTQSHVDLALHTEGHWDCGRFPIHLEQSPMTDLSVLGFEKILAFLQSRIVRCFLEDFLLLFSARYIVSRP